MTSLLHASREPVTISPTGRRFVERIKQSKLRTDVTLQPHQVEANRQIQQQLDDTGESRILLYHSLGSGKTLSALAAADAGGMPYTAIVPAALRNNLKKEREKFLTADSTSGQVISHNALMKQPELENPDSLLVDEAQRFRNQDSAQTRGLMDAASKARMITLLSGTPIVNEPGDFAVPYNLLTGDDLTREEFKQRYIRENSTPAPWYKRMFGAEPTPPGVINVDELKRNLAGKVHYHKPADPGVTKIPEVIRTELSPSQARLHDAMYGKLPMRLRWGLRTGEGLTARDLKRLASFLTGPRQVGLSDNPLSATQSDPLDAFHKSPKLTRAMEELQKTLAENPKAKAVVFSNFVNSGINPYRAALQAQGIPAGVFTGSMNDAQRKRTVDDYNAGRTRVALISPAGTEGISLKGTRLAQILDPAWNEARVNQSEGRAIRYDSHTDLPLDERNVRVQRYVSRLPPGVLDRMKAVFTGKDYSQPATDDYLYALAARKQRINDQLLRVLQEIGSGG